MEKKKHQELRINMLKSAKGELSSTNRKIGKKLGMKRMTWRNTETKLLSLRNRSTKRS